MESLSNSDRHGWTINDNDVDDDVFSVTWTWLGGSIIVQRVKDPSFLGVFRLET